MFKFSLGSDNHSGVHPQILQALLQANQSHAPAYGTDPITEAADKEFKKQFGPNSQAFFVFNGTAANVLCLKAMVRSHQSVIASSTCHLHHDECGAPEAQIGCKVLLVPTRDGKITPETIKQHLIRGGDQHYSQPKCVSVTQVTELGTVYSRDELKAIGDLCKQNGLYFHIDGARFAVAAASQGKTLKELSADVGCDALSFGGTKNGLLMGEACVFFNSDLAKEFTYIRKQSMQLPSKMRFISAQFLCYLENDLWREIAVHEIQMARYLEKGLREIRGIEIVQKVEANAVFIKFPKAWTKALKEEAFFYIWDENEWIARLMCTFDTQTSDLDRFIKKAASLGRL